MATPNSPRNILLGLTMGDPAGVGPEIIAGAWPELFSIRHPSGKKSGVVPVVFGDPSVMARAVALRSPGVTIVELDAQQFAVSPRSDLATQILSGPKTIPVIRACNKNAADVKPGTLDAAGGDAAFSALNRGIDFALAKKIDALVTAPLNKESMNAAGHPYPGHTEVLAARCGVGDYGMMLYLGPGEPLVSPDGLAVLHVTLHTAMQNVFRQITKRSVLEKCRLLHHFLRVIKGGKEPALAVASLNCHNGEQGLFGDEERKKIAPAVRAAQREGMNVSGPFPSDTLFLAAREGRYDGVVAMIHDQGHIAVKLIGMHRAVNITLGLPIIRTSVAHGTAFDIAWQGIAKTTSLVEAVRVAILLAQAKRGEQ